MSVNYAPSVITARLQAVINSLDDGPSAGTFQLLDSLGNVLSTMPLADPAGQAVGTVLQFSGLSLIDPAAARSGTATAAQFTDSLGNVEISGLTVGTAAQVALGAVIDVVLSPTNVITAGQTIALTNATIQGR